MTALDDDHLLVFGGFPRRGVERPTSVLRDGAVFSLSCAKWTRLPALPDRAKFSYPAGGADNGHLLLVGNACDRIVNDELRECEPGDLEAWLLDLATDQWRQAESPPIDALNVKGARVSASGSQFVLTSPQAAAVFEVKTGWTPIVRSSAPNSTAAICAGAGVIAVVSATDAERATDDDGYVSPEQRQNEPTTVSISVRTPNGRTIQTPRPPDLPSGSRVTAVCAGSSILVFTAAAHGAASAGREDRATVNRFDMATLSWHELKPPRAALARSMPPLVTVAGSKVLIPGRPIVSLDLQTGAWAREDTLGSTRNELVALGHTVVAYARFSSNHLEVLGRL